MREESGCMYVRRGRGGEWVYVCEEGQGRRVGVRTYVRRGRGGEWVYVRM